MSAMITSVNRNETIVVVNSYNENLVSQQDVLEKSSQQPRQFSRKIFSNRVAYDEVNRKLDKEALLIIKGGQNTNEVGGHR